MVALDCCNRDGTDRAELARRSEKERVRSRALTRAIETKTLEIDVNLIWKPLPHVDSLGLNG